MKYFILTLALFATHLTCLAANIVILTVEDPNNYDAVNSMRGFAEKELRPLGHRVIILEGNQPKPTHFEGLVTAVKDADLLVLFARRCTLPKEQLDAIRAHLDAGKPLLGIRTANRAFLPLPTEPVKDPKLAIWPEFTPEVLGGENTGYETKGMPYSVSIFPGSAGNPLLNGVNAEKIRGHIALYKVLPLAADTTPLLIGTAQGQQPAQPVAWTRLYGRNKARIFYTSLGAPEDMPQPDVRRLLLNGLAWTLKKMP
ncbi:MAG: ThuA domain-containing protein [Verrucomicrobiaceae bacterium]|nr:ThuA domain-containing protein [Verrucomicrobiaceae bacterium]